MVQKQLSLKLKLTSILNYNAIVKRFSQVGPGGKKLGEKLAEKASENLSKTSSSMPYISSPNVKSPEKPNFSKSKSANETNDSKDNQKNPNITKKQPLENKIPISPSSELPINNISGQPTSPIKNFVDKEKNNPLPPPVNLKDKFIKENYPNNEKPSIPNPPPLPNVPLVKAIKKINIEIICPETLEAAKKNLQSQHHIPPTTKITADTKPDELSREEILKEIMSRGMAKKDEKPSPIAKLKDHDNNIVKTPVQIANIKINSLGMAYLAEEEAEPSITYDIKEYNSDDYEFFLAITIPNYTEETCLLSGKQTHIIAVVAKKKESYENEEYNLIGYLTSQKTKNLIANKQFDKFQEEKDNEITNENLKSNKPQYFAGFKNLESISKENMIKLKYSDEYLNQPNILDLFRLNHVELIKKKGKIFNPSGITRQDLLNICQKYDKIVVGKKSQPQTDEQKTHQDENIKKQKKDQEEKKLLKYQDKKEDEGIE
jgi:hypothetical protein